MNILLIEDDEVDIYSVHRAFANIDLQVDMKIVHDGLDALKVLNEKKESTSIPDLIILDINMPKMNGIEFLAEVRKHPEWDKSKVLVLTTSSNTRDQEQIAYLNADGYLIKPIHLKEFDEFITSISVTDWTKDRNG